MTINCETGSHRTNPEGKYHFLGIIQKRCANPVFCMGSQRGQALPPRPMRQAQQSSGCRSSTTLGFTGASPAHRNHVSQNQALNLKDDDYSLYSSKRFEHKLNCKGTVSPPTSVNCIYFSFTCRFYAKEKMNLPSIFISTTSFRFPVQ